ncbi:MAG: hypothetical protein U0517_01135 [Candidatus Andersenbacteria bacterium]
MIPFADGWYDLAGTLHGIAALGMFVAFVMGLIFLLAVSAHNWKHIQLAGFAATLLYLASFGFGTLLYPHFSVFLRSTLEKTPSSAALFAFKEHLTALGICIALPLLVLIVFGHLRHASTWRRQLFAALFVTLAFCTFITMGISFILEARRA